MKTQALALQPGLADLHPGSPVPTPFARRPARPSLGERIANWRRVAGERRRLRELDPHLLKDIGLTEAEAGREATRPFWDVGPLR